MTARTRAAAAVQAEAKQESKPEATPEATPDTKPETPTFNWDADALPEVEVVEYVRAGVPRVDVENDTPEFVKQRITESYNAYDKAYNDAMEDFGKPENPTDGQVRKASDVANKASSRRQRFNTPEQAKEFVRLAKRYAKFKGWTLKGDVDKGDPKMVPFRAKHPEVRTRIETPATPGA